MADYTNSKAAIGSVFPTGAIDAQEWTRVEPLLTPEQLITRFLYGIPRHAFTPDPVTGKRDELTNETLQDYIFRAVAEAELMLGITIFPIQYTERQAFWDAWRCRECHPDAKGARRRWIEQQHAAGSGPSRVP